MKSDKAAILARLPVKPGEDPFEVTIGGFYRRWFNLIDDIQAVIDTVKSIKSTEDEDWVPAWSAVAARYEKDAEAALARGDRAGARNAFLQAKCFYSLARFPQPYHGGSAICAAGMSPIKAESYQRYLEAYRRATELLERRPELVKVQRDGKEATGYLHLPKGASASKKVPAVLVMCGGDMYKEDREKYADYALAEDMAALVVDAPGTGQTTFAHAPESVGGVAGSARRALQAARDRRQPPGRVRREPGRAVGHAPRRARSRASRGSSPARREAWATGARPRNAPEWRSAAAERAKTNWFGPRGTRPAPKPISEDEQRKEFLRWSLKDNGLLDKLTMPMYLVNGKVDHLTPIGNLYLLLESGPPTGRVARVYADDGHIAARNEREWGPAAWRWLRQTLTA
jgi:hypothetical protein